MHFELHQEPHRHYKLVQDNGTASWNIGKRRLVSVTQVLDESGDRLWQWAVGQAYLAGEAEGLEPGLAERAYTDGRGPEAIRDRAAALGSASHAALERVLLHGGWRGAAVEAKAGAAGSSLDAADLYPRLLGMEQFLSDYRLDPLEVEQATGSVRHAYAGTFDVFGRLNGVRSLIDAKNTTMPSWRHAVQLAAYEAARREEGRMSATRLHILYLTAYGTYTLVDTRKLATYSELRRTFLHTLSAMRHSRKLSTQITKLGL